MVKGNAMITEQDEWDFTHGACWVLANAISDATGWQRCMTAPEPEHVFVRTPDGDYLDIHGRWSEDEMIEKYSSPWGYVDSIADVNDWDDLSDGDWFFGWQPRYRKRAEELVPEVLALPRVDRYEYA